jgi:hypothetical protein
MISQMKFLFSMHPFSQILPLLLISNASQTITVFLISLSSRNQPWFLIASFAQILLSLLTL